MKATLSKDDVKAIKEKAVKGQQADAVVIKASELARIKDSTKVIGKQQEMDEKKRLAEEREREREAATTLRDKIKAFDQTRTKKLPPTVYQKEAKEKNETLLTKAEKAMDEELDDVKHMNKMVLYAKCATVRDRQLTEMRELEKAKKDEDMKVDLMMEVERLKALQFHEEREHVHRQAQHQGALVIVDQIKDREQQRVREQELKNKEQMQMLKQIEELQADEVKQQQKKLERAKQLMLEVEESNRQAISIKQETVTKEKEVDAKIADYNKKKAQREEEQQAELKRLHDEKEREIQRLREKQLRAINKQAEIDELKARRAFEQSERQTREKEARENEERVSFPLNSPLGQKDSGNDGRPANASPREGEEDGGTGEAGEG
jgi:hypothetical protein